MIAGVTAGWLVAGAPAFRPLALQMVSGALPGKVPATFSREVVLFAALGALPDVDLLFGMHSGPTHGLGAAILVGLVASLAAWRMKLSQPMRIAGACAMAYASHILLDWLGRDSSPPIGIMALWPFSHAYYESELHLFLAISRRYYQGWVFVRQNAIALVRELVLLVPLLTMIVLFRSRPEPG
jgi:membrane-bound metal-dependent hydrolase YbcI (DUF457 family)